MSADNELLTIEDHWDFEYRYFAGEVTSRFLVELRDAGRIMGTRCPSCERVLVPARSFCDWCYVEAEDWIEVGPSGVVETFTIIATRLPGLPDPPIAIAYVTLKGADTAVLNVVRGLDLTDVETAAATLMARPTVTAAFADERRGRITDFHFEIAVS